MKNRILIYTFMILGITLLTTGCKKDEENQKKLVYGSVTDVEGTVYKTIVIGTQTWMAENLKTTQYNDGTPIPLVTGESAWYELSTPGYCWYNNNATANKAMYGALYNWFTINTVKLCPKAGMCLQMLNGQY